MAMFELVNSVAQSPTSPVKLETRNILLLNGSHPDGHYLLDLSHKCDFGTAQRLITLGSWDKHRHIARKAPDISQHGNFETFRNTKHMGTNFIYDSTWTVPLQGTFEFDYVSPNKLNPLLYRRAMETNDALTVTKVNQITIQFKSHCVTSVHPGFPQIIISLFLRRSHFRDCYLCTRLVKKGKQTT